MLMKKSLALFSAGILSIGILAACSSDDAENSSSTEIGRASCRERV